MMVKTRLAEIEEELTGEFEKVSLKGEGLSSFLHVEHKGRGVEVSESDGNFWLEFWEKSDDEDAAPVKEVTVISTKQAVQEMKGWLI